MKFQNALKLAIFKLWNKYRCKNVMTVLILFCIKKEPLQALLNGGRGGIRTHGTLAGSTVFKTGPINHSGTLPSGSFR